MIDFDTAALIQRILDDRIGDLYRNDIIVIRRLISAALDVFVRQRNIVCQDRIICNLFGEFVRAHSCCYDISTNRHFAADANVRLNGLTAEEQIHKESDELHQALELLRVDFLYTCIQRIRRPFQRNFFNNLFYGQACLGINRQASFRIDGEAGLRVDLRLYDFGPFDKLRVRLTIDKF